MASSLPDDSSSSELMAEGTIRCRLLLAKNGKKRWRQSLKAANRRLSEVNKKLYIENAELRREVCWLKAKLKFA
jgi:hypothetical protein